MTNRRCTRAARASLRGAAKAALLAVNACAAFMSVVVMSAGILVGSSDSSTVTAHMWTRVKGLTRYTGLTGIQFSSDTAYQTCFAAPANALAILGVAGLAMALAAVASAACGSRRVLQAFACASALGLAGAAGLALAIAASPSLRTSAKAALGTEMLAWTTAYGIFANASLSSASSSSSLAAFGGVFLDYLQITRRCCGWNSYKDYSAAVGVPASCCQLHQTVLVPVDPDCLLANSTLGWYGVGCGNLLYDDLPGLYLPELAIAVAMLTVTTASAVTMACVTSNSRDFVRLLREAAME